MIFSINITTKLDDCQELFKIHMVQNMLYYKQRKGCFIQESSADEDDEYDSEIFTDQNAQNLRRIKQRKEHCFIQA